MQYKRIDNALHNLGHVVRPEADGMGSRLVVAALLMAACAGSEVRKPTVDPACPLAPPAGLDLVNPAGPRRETPALLAVNASMCTSEIVRQLGPAHRDVGSGIYVLQWDATDGQVLTVGTSNLRARPMYVRWNQQP